jgi:hypothetical protein
MKKIKRRRTQQEGNEFLSKEPDTVSTVSGGSTKVPSSISKAFVVSICLRILNPLFAP